MLPFPGLPHALGQKVLPGSYEEAPRKPPSRAFFPTGLSFALVPLTIVSYFKPGGGTQHKRKTGPAQHVTQAHGMTTWHALNVRV